MNPLETEDYESTDISDALINEAARLENEYRDQGAEKSDKDSDEADGGKENLDGTLEVGETENVDFIRKNESIENSPPQTVTSEKPPDSATKSTPFKTSELKPVRKENVSSPEKRKDGSSSLKRKSVEDSLESLRPQPPDPKRLKKGFKIPKLSKQGPSIPKFSLSLTEEQKQFLAELERDFAERYTDQDEDYVKASTVRLSPPLVEGYHCPPKRQFNRHEGSSHYDRNNRNSSPHSHSRHGHHQKYSRDHPNDRDYPNNRDHSSSRDYSNNRYQQRPQHRYQPY